MKKTSKIHEINIFKTLKKKKHIAGKKCNLKTTLNKTLQSFNLLTPECISSYEKNYNASFCFVVDDILVILEPKWFVAYLWYQRFMTSCSNIG